MDSLNCEQGKEKASSLIEKGAPIYNVSSRASMAISTSMDSLNINKCKHPRILHHCIGKL